MEKEKYEKPLFELITLLDANIITVSPEEGDVPETDDDDENSAVETAKKMVTSLLPWLTDEEGQDGKSESENINNDESQEVNQETTDDSNKEDASTFSSTLSDGLNELLNDVIPSGEGLSKEDGNNDSNSFVEEDNKSEQSIEIPSTEDAGW